jgi:hypothetical protein
MIFPYDWTIDYFFPPNDPISSKPNSVKQL